MPPEPTQKRVIAFIDGQNLFYAAKQAFGYDHPNYDVRKLCAMIAHQQSGWSVTQERFYTGMPSEQHDPFWYHFWNAKLASMGRSKIYHFTRALRYRTESVTLPDGSTHSFPVRQEKGIDVRLALDVVRLALEGMYDVALIFSQDQDLSEVADEVKSISKSQSRWIGIASAFPYSSSSTNTRGINRTDWIRIDQTTYDLCIDSVDYRPKKKSTIP